ncbi:MAG: multidrug effflux MFS transporter [Rhodobacter sp.]|nr:multidrug effflux MFS transporter [Rhodobacter sp.]
MTSEPQVRFLDRTTPPHIFTLIMIAGVSALSMNVFLPSLPNMTEYFATDYRLMQLSVAIYLGVNAVLQIIVGPISDRYGRRPVVLAGFLIFVLASIGCVYAPTAETFLAFRMIQAFVVVGIVLSRAIVRDMVPQDQAASMIGYVTMGMAVVPMIGPAVGGVLDEIFGWQANFWMLVLLGAITMWLVWSDLGETAAHRSSSFSAQFRQYPELLMARRFWGYCLAAAFGSGAFFAYLGGAPYIGTEVFGLDPAQLGFYFGAPAVGYFLGNFISGRYSIRFGINRMILTGTIIVSCGMACALVVFYGGFGSVQSFFGFMTFMGLGNGLLVPNANAGMLSVRPHLAGSASGLGGAIMIGGGAALSALAGALLTPGTGAFPLLWIMFITSVMSFLSILYVVRRERTLALA